MEILFFVISFLCFMTAPLILSYKNRGWGYILLAIFLPPIGFIVAICLKTLKPKEIEENCAPFDFDITKTNDINNKVIKDNSQREGIATNVVDTSIYEKEMIVHSQETEQQISVKKKKIKSFAKIFVHIKNYIVKMANDFRQLNFDAKIGVLLLTPGIFGFIIYIPIEICNSHNDSIAIPLFLGLMAIAGAYLIKGN